LFERVRMIPEGKLAISTTIRAVGSGHRFTLARRT
jgi:hypothetical protein